MNYYKLPYELNAPLQTIIRTKPETKRNWKLSKNSLKDNDIKIQNLMN